jgi:hypothetical protein
VLGSGLRRYSARLNLDQQVGNRFEFAGTVSASQARTKSVPSSGQQNGNSGAIAAALQVCADHSRSSARTGPTRTSTPI